ncbi:MAG: amidohydrolase family protein [Chloroflexi bacterium]|nr:amidohydrolase family protein [Chloroflexota bacterium]
MRIDAHQHYWKLNRGDYGWLTPDMGVLYRDYLPADLEPSLERHRIDKTVLVQAAPTTAETDYMLSLAAENDSIGGVVGWLDMADPKFPQLFEEYRQQPAFVGIRPMLHDLSDNAWVTQPVVLENLTLLAECDFPFDFLVRPQHLPYVLQVLEKVSNLRAVIDHIAKPDIKAQQFEPWASDLNAIAQHENVYCKLSGMVTEADHANWMPADLQPYVSHTVECFGPARVMYGSDWPVSLLAARYDDVIGALEEALDPGLGEVGLANVFGGNAGQFYGIAK